MTKTFCDLCLQEGNGLQPLDAKFQTSLVGELCRSCMDRVGQKLTTLRDEHDKEIMAELREFIKQVGVVEHGHEDKPI